jgi:hypothetical protein
LQNKDLATDYLKELNDPLEGFNIAKTWGLKKKLSPKNTPDPPMAKKDGQGNLVTDKAGLKELYLKTYMDRLKPNQIKPGLETLEEMKEYLFKLRFDICKERKSEKWTMKDLENVFKSLKSNKARDAHGHTYELYKYGGRDLKLSLLKLLNLVKEKQVYPTIFQPANITSLYKSRGEKSDFNNDRGIFNVVKIRSILDRLIYNQKYPIIDDNMSTSNIGARKGRNIRDHLFVINSILHDVTMNERKNIDIEIYDIKKCFDKMWAAETANDAFNAGLDDDQFVLVANSNSSCQVAVRTPWGSLTRRETLQDIEMQGGVLTPIKCSIQIDTLGKEMLESVECSRTMFKYKDCVSIPVLSMIDDVLSVTECGPDSVKVNAYVQSKTDTKKLELGESKCFKIHIGNDNTSCPSLKIQDQEMKSSSSEKYLGDILTNSAKIDENVQMRCDKGIGISNQILSTLKEVSFGIYYFEMAMLFRTSQLVNGILYNTEAMLSIKERHLTLLEDSDKYLMRSLFDTEMCTPIEGFYIETSTIPFRFILQGRRIMYYWTILRKSESELVRQVFNAQQEFPDKNGSDWVSQVRQDLIACEIFHTEDEIRNMSKYKFKKLVNSRIKLNCQTYLTELQMKHSKTMYLRQESAMKEYLKTDLLKLKEKQLLFKLRVRMTPNKTNFPNKYKNDVSCSLCKNISSEENLLHLLQCPFLTSHPDVSADIGTIKAEDIFGALEQQIKAVKIWMKIFKIYNQENKI